jgi:integrase
MAATKPLKETGQIAKVKKYFLSEGHIRDYTLFTVGINTALRIGDVLSLRWDDVYDFGTGAFRSHIDIEEHKTGKRNSVPLNKNAVEALSRLMVCAAPADGGQYVFKSRKGHNRPISRNRAYSILTEVAMNLPDVEKFSCHSLRKTFGYHAWQSGAPSVLLMHIYNHSSFNITKHYLGIDQQEKDQLYGHLLL